MAWHRVCLVEPVAGECPAGESGYVQWESLALELFDAAALGVTPEVILEVFGWGFGSIILMWSIGYGVGVAKRLIRSV